MLLQFKIMFIYFNIPKNIIDFCDAVLNFQHNSSSLHSSVHDPSEIILKCWFIINIVNSCAAYLYLFIINIHLFIYLEPVILFWGSLIKEQHLFKKDMFSNNINLSIPDRQQPNCNVPSPRNVARTSVKQSIWHQWLNFNFAKLREYFLCVKKTKLAKLLSAGRVRELSDFIKNTYKWTDRTANWILQSQSSEFNHLQSVIGEQHTVQMRQQWHHPQC